MIYPRVCFSVSAKKDFETLHAFAKDAEYDGGRSLDWAVFSKYPHLKTQFDKRRRMKSEEALCRFVFSVYRAKKVSMNLALRKHRKRWECIAPCFFSLVDELFDGRAWPQGKYIAFGTIWSMYPRFLEDKTFQIPFWHRTPRYVPVVIAHELLHLMFYDYFYAHYPKCRRSKDNLFVWHISEIFNTIVQNSPAWLRYFKLKSLGYPEHKKIIQRIRNAWYKKNMLNLDALVEKIKKEVRNSSLSI